MLLLFPTMSHRHLHRGITPMFEGKDTKKNKICKVSLIYFEVQEDFYDSKGTFCKYPLPIKKRLKHPKNAIK